MEFKKKIVSDSEKIKIMKEKKRWDVESKVQNNIDKRLRFHERNAVSPENQTQKATQPKENPYKMLDDDSTSSNHSVEQQTKKKLGRAHSTKLLQPIARAPSSFKEVTNVQWTLLDNSSIH